MTEHAEETKAEKNAGKLAMIAAKRQTLENELYAAELDLKIAKKGKAEELVAGPAERVETLQEQVKVLDAEEAKLT